MKLDRITLKKKYYQKYLELFEAATDSIKFERYSIPYQDKHFIWFIYGWVVCNTCSGLRKKNQGIDCFWWKGGHLMPANIKLLSVCTHASHIDMR